MTKYTPSQLAEIARIKDEHYCGTAKARAILNAVEEQRKFAREVSALRETETTWQEAYAMRHLPMRAKLDVFNQDATSEAAPLDEDYTLGAVLDQILTLEDITAQEAVNATVLLPEDYVLDVLGNFKPHSALSLVELDRETLVPAVGRLGTGATPLHMRQTRFDTLYLRMKEEDTLHMPELQKCFLARSAQAFKVSDVGALTKELKSAYRYGQKNDSDFFNNQAMAEAAAYGLGLLGRSDLRGWLRKYLER